MGYVLTSIQILNGWSQQTKEPPWFVASYRLHVSVALGWGTILCRPSRRLRIVNLAQYRDVKRSIFRLRWLWKHCWMGCNMFILYILSDMYIGELKLDITKTINTSETRYQRFWKATPSAVNRPSPGCQDTRRLCVACQQHMQPEKKGHFLCTSLGTKLVWFRDMN